MVFGEGTPAKQVLLDAISYLKKNWKKTNDDIVKIMMELQLEGENGSEVKKEDRINFATYLTETIKNMSLHINDKSEQCRYSPHIVNISQSLYLRSKSAHNELRSSGILQLPSSRTMKRTISHFRMNPGLDPKVIYTLKEQLTNVMILLLVI